MYVYDEPICRNTLGLLFMLTESSGKIPELEASLKLGLYYVTDGDAVALAFASCPKTEATLPLLPITE